MLGYLLSKLLRLPEAAARTNSIEARALLPSFLPRMPPLLRAPAPCSVPLVSPVLSLHCVPGNSSLLAYSPPLTPPSSHARRWACRTAPWAQCWRAPTSRRTRWRPCPAPSLVRARMGGWRGGGVHVRVQEGHVP